MAKFDYAALVKAQTSRLDMISNHVAARDPKKNDDNPFADTAKEASVIQDETQLGEFLARENAGEIMIEEYKGQAKLRKMLVAARACLSLGINLDGNAGDAFIARHFPTLTPKTRTTTLSHLRTLRMAVQSGVVDEVVAGVWQRRQTGEGSLFNMVLSAFAAAKKAAKGTEKAMALPDKASFDEVVAKAQAAKDATTRTASEDKPLDELVEAHVKAFKNRVNNEATIETILTLFRVKLEKLIPKDKQENKSPVTNSADLASPAK